MFNGERYDGCRPENGNLLEAKGEGYTNKISGPNHWQVWFTGIASLEQQMYNHSLSAGDRVMEYHFAEKEPADYFRGYAARQNYHNIVVFYTPQKADK